jgi:tyrosyl-tRNA synthetase
LQYFLRTLDEHAEQYLKIFTLLPLEQITEIVLEHTKRPEKRLAQRTLAEEVVSLIHCSQVAEKCIFQTAALYPAPRNLSSPEEKQSPYRPDLILRAFQGDEIMLKKLSRSSVTNLPLPRLVKEIGLTTSYSLFPLIHKNPLTWTGEAYRSFQNGGVYINGVQERKTDRVMDNDLLIDGKMMVIRHGKSSFRIIEVVSDEEAEYYEGLVKQDGSNG